MADWAGSAHRRIGALAGAVAASAARKLIGV